jgi:two-component system, NtrC family, sensor kinase
MHDSNPPSRRILIIDDNAAIHHDFRKVLGAQADQSAQAVLDVLEADLFGTAVAKAVRPNFEIDSAHQGQEGVKMASQAVAEGRPYVMAFVDMRMPPGWDGLETIEHLWETDPDVQVVICSAHTDYDWTEVVARSAAMCHRAQPQVGKRTVGQRPRGTIGGSHHGPHARSGSRESAAASFDHA